MPYTSTGLRECLTRRREGVRLEGGPRARQGDRPHGPGRGRGRRHVGLRGRAAFHGHREPTIADGSANLNMGAADLGTGTKTVMAMVVAEELGVPLDRIQIENADTGTTQYTGPSGGSKTVPSDSPAVRAAALEVKAKLLAMAAEQLKVPAESLTLSNGEISGPGGNPKVAVGASDGAARAAGGGGRRQRADPTPWTSRSGPSRRTSPRWK